RLRPRDCRPGRPPGPGEHARSGRPDRRLGLAREPRRRGNSSRRAGARRTWREDGGSVSQTEESAARPLSLLVVDDHEVVRQGLVALLGRRREFQVVAEAGTVAEALQAARRFQPDLVVMDVRLPDGSGIEACREIRAEFPATRVIILTSYPDEDAVL